ncbi:MAG: branched-chain amino acid ABC transporter permease [Actinomycetota bacterium]|nr:branched-chain amino acid ABC transporter permease [Actinomycetota bacterium]MDK1016628.1 branched-chain amino acid ABC transporter permease [Actinomycetota bacterium]MDK1027008.1 branched-chain amino acid ABC transporter permease [Actinomycetota bacterium]MDK1038482.1 branched-chain amino acid ABC transporter permease [Actinomycetota bacterium]MDK1096328.1 branched-chain amino acid ABC transporter permease [Actinomycetota bacterium]
MGFVVVAQVVTQAPVERFLNALGSGVALGAIYAMLALGFVIIFKATQVVNFAHGGLAALGAYLVSYFATVSNIPGRWMGDISVTLQWTLSALLALAVMAFIGVVIERITIRPMIGEPLFAVAMITLGLDLVIRTTTNDLMNNTNQGLGDPWGVLVVEIGFFRIAQTQIVAIVVLLLVGLLLARFFKTRTGLALRATAFDQEVAMAQGISVGKVFAIAWGIGAALAALGGIFSSVAPRGAGVDPFTALIAFRAFPAIIIGGLDSIKGAVVGGLIVGVAEVLAGTYLGGVAWLGIGFGGVVPWLLMMVVLLVRPYGLFGTPEIRRV